MNERARRQAEDDDQFVVLIELSFLQVTCNAAIVLKSYVESPCKAFHRTGNVKWIEL